MFVFRKLKMFEASNVNGNILRVVFQDPFKVDEFDKVFSIIISVLEKGNKIAVLADMRKTSKVPAETASKLKAWMRKNTELFRKNMVCTAVLMNNTATNMLIRQLLKGIFLVQKPVKPNGMFVSETKCLDWIGTRFKKLGADSGPGGSSSESPEEGPDVDD